MTLYAIFIATWQAIFATAQAYYPAALPALHQVFDPIIAAFPH